MREQLDTIKHMHRFSSRGIRHRGPWPGGLPFCRFSQRRRSAYLADIAPRSYRRDELPVSVLFIFCRPAAVDQPGASDGGRPFDRGGSAG